MALKFIKIVPALALVAGCAQVEAIDRGLIGTPSPSVAMYVAQLRFAQSACQSEGLLQNPDASAKFVSSSAERGIAVSQYAKHAPVFLTYVNDATGKYTAARSRMSSAEKEAFCQDFSSDVARAPGGTRTFQRSMDLQGYYSPPTGAAIERNEGAAILVGALSIGATAAGVAQADNGNFAGADRLNSVGAGLSGAVQSQDTPKAKYCASYAPFAKATSPSFDPVWKKYHSIQGC